MAPLAVYIFFIISGDALLSPYIATSDIAIIQRTSLNRYARLTAPILLSCLICYAVLKLGLNHNIEASKILKREDWLGIFANFNASLLETFKYSTYGVYFNHTTESSYNPFLWTMSIEMLGSFLIFIFALQLSNLRHPIKVAAFIAIMFFLAKSYYSLFFVGAAFSLLRDQGFFNHEKSKIPQIFSWAILLIVIASCLHSKNIATDSVKTNTVRAVLLVFAIHGNATIKQALETGLSKFLGKISFSLYLVHFSVLISLTSYLAILINNKGLLNLNSAIYIGLLTAAFCVLLALALLKVESSVLKRINLGLDAVRRTQ